MSVPQNTIAIIYDYDQTLSPTYMQEEAIFPVYGINPDAFWKKCQELVREQGYDNELAYMKVMLDYLEMDRPKNTELRALGARLSFYKGLPEMFEEFRSGLLSPEHAGAWDHGRALHRIVRPEGAARGSKLAPFVKAIFGCEFAEDSEGRITFRAA